MKYNWSIIGHENQLNRIERDIETGNLGHAYLLTGQNSVGKYTVASKMAGILQCENDFCHKCNICLQVEKGCHIDTIEFKDNKESIKIEEVRKLIERLNMTRQARYKILLIQKLERMTIEAANSFLKILEEPPGRTIFIMTTDNVRGLLPTLLSRVRIVKFGSVSDTFLKKNLTELYPDHDEKVINQVSLFSLGKTGKAIQLMNNPDILANYLKVYHDVQNFLDHKNITDRFSYVEELIRDDKMVELFLDILTHILRSKMLEGERAKHCTNMISLISEASILLKRNVNDRLVLENLMLSL